MLIFAPYFFALFRVTQGQLQEQVHHLEAVVGPFYLTTYDAMVWRGDYLAVQDVVALKLLAHCVITSEMLE